MPNRAAIFVLLLAGFACSALAAAPAPAAPRDSFIKMGTLPHSDGYVRTRGAIIYYESIGTGPPLIVLHGGPGMSHDYFLPGLLPLANDYRLILIDERGCGRSQRLPDTAQYNLDAMEDDVEDLRLALGLTKINLLGHSVGGILAQAYAIKHPETLQHLILAGTVASAREADARLSQILKAEPIAVQREIARIEKSGIFDANGAFNSDYARVSGPIINKYNYFRALPPAASVYSTVSIDVYRAMWGSESDYRVTGNMRGFDFSSGLRQLNVPTLVIYGDHDILPEVPARRLHELIKGSLLVEVPQAGHMAFDDNPAFYLTQISQFLTR